MTKRGVNENQMQQSKGPFLPLFLVALVPFLFGESKAAEEDWGKVSFNFQDLTPQF